jgi:ubiquinone/menaquinone biosynthesis C-methylase UbiE
MQLARGLRWEVTGLDVSRWAADQVRQRFGLEVVNSTIEEAPFPDDSFDVIHMSHVLEHLPDPVSALARVARLLRPDGRVVIEVPNEFQNLHTWMRLRSATAHPYAVGSTHLWFFTPETLRSIVRLAGLTIERARTFRDIDDAKLFRRLAKLVVSALEAIVDRGPLIELVASRSDGLGRVGGRVGPAEPGVR